MTPRDNRSHLLNIARDIVARHEAGECIGIDDLAWARTMIRQNGATQ